MCRSNGTGRASLFAALPIPKLVSLELIFDGVHSHKLKLLSRNLQDKISPPVYW